MLSPTTRQDFCSPPRRLSFSRPAHLGGVRVRRDADAGGVALGPSPWEPLVEFLGDEGHEGGEEAQADL